MFRAFKQALRQVFRNRAMTFTSLFSITAMMLILGLFFILVVNVNVMTENAKQKFDTIEVYLLEDTSDALIESMKAALLDMDNVASVEYIDKDMAMAEMKSRWGDNAYLLDGLQDNPFPRSLRVKVNEIEDADAVVQSIKNFEGVEDIKYYQTEVDTIVSITKGIQTGALVLIIFLIIISVIVVSNTVKLTVLARGREIRIMKYVGATNWFVRGPFLVEGMLLGVFASIIAAALITGIYYKVMSEFSAKAMLLFSAEFVPVEFLAFNLVIIFLALGVSIGTVGSIISMRRFLEV